MEISPEGALYLYLLSGSLCKQKGLHMQRTYSLHLLLKFEVKPCLSLFKRLVLGGFMVDAIRRAGRNL